MVIYKDFKNGARAGSELFQSETEIAFPHEPHILFFVKPLHSSAFICIHSKGNERIYATTIDYNYTTTIFHDRDNLVLFILVSRMEVISFVPGKNCLSPFYQLFATAVSKFENSYL